MRITSVFLFSVLALLAVACNGAATATPTPTPAPPTPTATNTPTPTATPTATNTPTPTATPTATNTPTPTATPTPTPPPTLFNAVAVAEQSMVRLSRGSTRWSGVIIDASGLILTTSRNLGAAPVAEFTTVDGTTGQAWVVGRDDRNDVALLRITSPVRTYPALNLTTDTTIQIDEELATLAFSDAATGPLDKRNTRVVGVRQDLNSGVSYLQIQATVQAGAEGGVLIDSEAQIRGLRMTEAHMVNLGLGRAGEVFAMAAAALNQTFVSRLRAGYTEILPPDSSVSAGTDPGGPPPIPSTFFGSMTIGGASPSTAVRLYVQVSKAGLPDLWFSSEVKPEAGGEYLIAFGITASGYDGAMVSFWITAKKAEQTGTYSPSGFETLDLTFP